MGFAHNVSRDVPGLGDSSRVLLLDRGDPRLDLGDFGTGKFLLITSTLDNGVDGKLSLGDPCFCSYFTCSSYQMGKVFRTNAQ